MATAEVCQKLCLNPATRDKLRAKYRGMGVADVRRLKASEDEKAKLTRLLADAMLANVELKDSLGRPWPLRNSDRARRSGRWVSRTSRSVGRAIWSASIRRSGAIVYGTTSIFARQ